MEAGFEGINFENTATRTEVTKYYRVEGAPFMTGPHMVDQTKLYAPFSARFTFVDGDITDLHVKAHVVKQNGEVGEREEQVPSIYTFDQSRWPGWLKYLYKLAYADFNADRLARV